MKQSFNIIGTILIAIAMFLQSCDKNFEEINTNPNNSVNAYPYQLMQPAFRDLVASNMSRNRSLNNELMQITVSISDGEYRIFRYDIRNTVSDGPWNSIYPELKNVKEIYRLADGGINDNASYRGISLIMQTWGFSILTDTYGDIPYSEALRGLGEDILEPKFDTQKEIYLDFFNKLDSANVLLSKNTAIKGEYDPIYNGNVSKWRKFGNSLFLRLLLRASGQSDPAVATFVRSKINDILVDNASSYPVMSSNDDSAILRWTGMSPLISPFMDVRAQDFRQASLANFFIDHLVAWNDPRINIPTYGSNGVNRFGIAPISGNFVGIPSGYAPGEGWERQSYFYSYDQTVNNLPVKTMMNEPLTGMIMNCSELQFIKAELALKGFYTDKAGDLYKDGVMKGITTWLPTYTESIEDYLNNGDINWDENYSFEKKMEMIHLQKYYALLFVDCQQWFEFRRTGYPKLPKGTGLKNNGEMPARLNYPIYVQSANPTNYKLAVQTQGKDAIDTKVWWQRP